MSVTVIQTTPELIPQVCEVLYQTWLATYPNEEMGVAVDSITTEVVKLKDPSEHERLAEKLRNQPPTYVPWLMER